MLHAKSESDITSLAPSSPPRSPKRAVYYVQSPSRDSRDGDKSSSMQATPDFISPMESPSHPSFGRHSRNSSGSRFSGVFRSASGRKGGNKKRINDKGWPECDVIMEEGNYDDFDDDKTRTKRCQALMAFLCLAIMLTVFCLILWGAGRPYKPKVAVKSLFVGNLYVGSGADFTGVPTKMLHFNGTLRISVYNPASFFGIHVSATPVNLIYSDIIVATGELKKYYQHKKTHRNVTVNIEGTKVPLYGAGSNLVIANNGVQVPLTLEFEFRSSGHIIGKMVRTKHRVRVSCPLNIDSTNNKPIKFTKDSCTYIAK